jgi:putative FmdB family regulatory protein
MPNYEFSCSCGYSEEAFLQIVDRNKPRSCPECNKVLIRLIGKGSGIIFKGDGFYETDYKRTKISD